MSLSYSYPHADPDHGHTEWTRSSPTPALTTTCHICVESLVIFPQGQTKSLGGRPKPSQEL